MNRRTVIAAGPLAGLAAALVAGDVNGAVVEALSVGERETPVARQYREAMRLWDRQADPDNTMSDDELEALSNRFFQLANSIVDLSSEGPMDFILKMMAHTARGEFCPCCCPDGDKLWAEARALIG